MAGSYKHIINDDGSFRGVDLLDDLGDAYEALEECFDMLKFLSGGDKTKIFEAYKYGYLMKHNPGNAEKLTYDKFWSVE